jgi:hypothetical protein
MTKVFVESEENVRFAWRNFLSTMLSPGHLVYKERAVMFSTIDASRNGCFVTAIAHFVAKHSYQLTPRRTSQQRRNK